MGHFQKSVHFRLDFFFKKFYFQISNIKFDKSIVNIQQNSRLESATGFVLSKHLLLCLSITLLQVSVQLLCLLAENIYLMIESILLEYTLFKILMVRVN